MEVFVVHLYIELYLKLEFTSKIELFHSVNANFAANHALKKRKEKKQKKNKLTAIINYSKRKLNSI